MPDDPYRDELFVGLASEGAYCNGRRMAPARGCTTLDRALVITDIGYERSAKGARRLATCHEALLNANTYGVRIVGSTVLALAWLAAGRASAVYMGLGKKDCPKVCPAQTPCGSFGQPTRLTCRPPLHRHGTGARLGPSGVRVVLRICGSEPRWLSI